MSLYILMKILRSVENKVMAHTVIWGKPRMEPQEESEDFKFFLNIWSTWSNLFETLRFTFSPPNRAIKHIFISYTEALRFLTKPAVTSSLPTPSPSPHPHTHTRYYPFINHVTLHPALVREVSCRLEETNQLISVIVFFDLILLSSMIGYLSLIIISHGIHHLNTRLIMQSLWTGSAVCQISESV